MVNAAWEKEAKGFESFKFVIKIGNVHSALKQWDKLHFEHCQTRLKVVKSQPVLDTMLAEEASLQLSILEMHARVESRISEKLASTWGSKH